MANRNTYWRDPALGEAREIGVGAHTMRCFDTGAGKALVFVHGALVNPNLWRKVVARLSASFRCICLEMPLGSHEIAMPGADLSPTGLADLIAGACTALELESPTVIGNDTGGGICQVALSRHPDLAGHVVLTSCDAYENFPPRFFNYLLYPLRFPRVGPPAFSLMRVRAARNLPIAFGWLMNGKLEPEVGDSYVLPFLSERAVAEDLARVLRQLSPEHTLAAIERLRSYQHPVLIAWSREDRFFPSEHAERLAADIPGARLEWIEGARSFSPEDQPERLAQLIGDFAA